MVGQDVIDLLVTAAVDLDVAIVDPSTSQVHRARDSDLDALGAVLLGRNVASVVADGEGDDGELRDEMDDEESTRSEKERFDAEMLARQEG